METPKNQNAASTSNMLKRLLEDEAYLKALEIIERAERNAYKNGCYGNDDE